MITYNGMIVMVDNNLSKIKYVKRTWKERIFSLNPFKKLKKVIVPDKNVYICSNTHTIYMSPYQYDKLKKYYIDEDKL